MASPRRWHRPMGLPALFAVIVAAGLAGAIPLVLAHPLAGGPSAARPGVAPPQVWTSGDSSWSNSSTSTFNATYQFHSFSADALTITATNTSATTVELVTTLTSEYNYSAQGCLRPCLTSNATFQESDASSSAQTYFENFTSGATVLENGTSVSALGVLSVGEFLSTASSAYVHGGAPGGATVAGSLLSSSWGHNAFAFSSPLGIVPWTIPTHGMWNGTGPFNDTSNFQQNYTVSGIFSNLSGVLGTGGTSSPFVAMSAPSDNGSSGGSGYSGSAPVPIGGFGYPGESMMSFCVSSNSTWGSGGNGSSGAYQPWQNTSCSVTTSGTEYVWGQVFGAPYYNVSAAAPVMIGFSGPYVPGPALGDVVAGSDLFGGAAQSWPPIYGLGGFYGNPPIGVPGSVGAGYPSPPPPPPVPSGFPIARTAPLDPAHSSSPAAGMMPGTETLVLVGLAALAGCLATAFLLRRRPGVPPPPPATR